MAISPASLPVTIPPSLAGRTIEVCWSALRAPRGGDPRPARLSVMLRPVNAQHAVVEAWIETPEGHLDLLRRQPAACELAVADGLVHLDVALDGRPVLALTLAPDGPGPRRALYARTALLADAGFPAGAYDPPTVRLEAARDAATA